MRDFPDISTVQSFSYTELERYNIGGFLTWLLYLFLFSTLFYEKLGKGWKTLHSSPLP